MDTPAAYDEVTALVRDDKVTASAVTHLESVETGYVAQPGHPKMPLGPLAVGGRLALVAHPVMDQQGAVGGLVRVLLEFRAGKETWPVDLELEVPRDPRVSFA